MNLEELRRSAGEIFRAGIAAVDSRTAVKNHLTFADDRLMAGSREYPLERVRNLYVIGAGKASAHMAGAVEELLGDRVAGGIICTKYGHSVELDRIRVVEAGHPIPDEHGEETAREIVDLIDSEIEADDLVLCLISGGGSALLPLPAQGISLEDKQHVTSLLINCGATIDEINAIRKHLSKLKGGQLARLVHPAGTVSLLLSDVVGDHLDVIASGPTVPDPTTFQDCLDVLTKFDLTKEVAPRVLRHLEQGKEGKLPETPKPGDSVFTTVQNVIVGSNLMAMDAAAARARELGFQATVLSSSITGDTREAARLHVATAQEIIATGNPLPPPACVISGGETTVVVKGKGKGGRNQEFVLAAAPGIAEAERPVVVLSVGTDGTDGPTEVAGAIADNTTLARASEKDLNAVAFLEDNDSYHFFEPLDDLIFTGPTTTNVMDLRLVLVG